MKRTKAPSYRVLADGLLYPVGVSLDRVVAAGGLSKLTAEELATVTVHTPAVGDIVDDIPPMSVSWLLAQGQIEAVDPAGDGRLAEEREE